MAKSKIVATIENCGGVFNSEKKFYTISENGYKKFLEIAETHIKKEESPKKKNYFKISNKNGTGTIYVFVETATKETTKKKEKKETAKKENVRGNGHKLRGDSYIVIYKNVGEKKETKKTDISTREELKNWLKTISRKNLEYLRIYDSFNNECRKSAWYEKRERKNA